MIELGATATQFLYGARAGARFTFGGTVAPNAVNQLIQGGYVERVPPGDPEYAPGIYRFTPKGAEVARQLPHHYKIVPSPKMDAPDLVSAVCICGYRSAPNTKARARHSGNVHVNAKKVRA